MNEFEQELFDAVPQTGELPYATLIEGVSRRARRTFHDLRRSGAITVNVDRTDKSNPVMLVSRGTSASVAQPARTPKNKGA